MITWTASQGKLRAIGAKQLYKALLRGLHGWVWTLTQPLKACLPASPHRARNLINFGRSSRHADSCSSRTTQNKNVHLTGCTAGQARRCALVG